MGFLKMLYSISLFLLFSTPLFAVLELSPSFSRDFPGLKYMQEKICEDSKQYGLTGTKLLEIVFKESKSFHFSFEDAKELFKNLDCGNGPLIKGEELLEFYTKSPPKETICSRPRD